MSVLSDDVIVNDRWIIPSTFLQQTVKQLEVIWEVVLSEVFQLNKLEVIPKKTKNEGVKIIISRGD